jgi:hypothetical protein
MRTTNSVGKEVKSMKEIRKELTREELEAQKIELLPDREEMQAVSVVITVSVVINVGEVGGNLAQVSIAQQG